MDAPEINTQFVNDIVWAGSKMFTTTIIVVTFVVKWLNIDTRINVTKLKESIKKKGIN